MITYYSDDDFSSNKRITVDFSGMGVKSFEIQCYLLDEDHNAELVRTEKTDSYDFSIDVDMTLFSTYLIKLKRVN